MGVSHLVSNVIAIVDLARRVEAASRFQVGVGSIRPPAGYPIARVALRRLGQTEGMPPGPLEDALDELYEVDPSEFVNVRKRLSATLRDAGDKAGAKLLQAARRPSTSAWTLNQVARREPQLVESVLDASSELFAAQTRGSNKPDMLRDAIRAHREAIDAATGAALGILGDRSNDKFRSEIVSTLRAVSTDEETATQLRAGRITREASAAGFPDAVGLTLVPDLPRSSATQKKAEQPTTRPARADAARAEREREEKRRAALAREEAARKEADAAEAEADRAQARVDELQDSLEAARRDLRKARESRRNAKSTLRDLR